MMFLSDDASRVLLAGGKDDYINASHIGVRLLPSVSLFVCLVVPSMAGLNKVLLCWVLSNKCPIIHPWEAIKFKQRKKSKQGYFLEQHIIETAPSVTFFFEAVISMALPVKSGARLFDILDCLRSRSNWKYSC